MPPLIPTTASAAPFITRASAGVVRPVIIAQQQQQQQQQKPPPQVTGAAVSTTASFSTTAGRFKFTAARRAFRKWEEGREGHALRRQKVFGQPSYLGSGSGSSDKGKVHHPFPLNPHFESTRVLDEKSREVIWSKIMCDGETIKAVSAEFGVDIRRVAAIVRLKEVEKDWIAKDKPLANQYARAVMGMLPRHRINPKRANEPFEPINELHVHPYTMTQLFWPTSESRHFTREDAAKAFHHTLLSPDERIPHPELVQMEREILKEDRNPYEASEAFKAAVAASEREAAEKQVAKAAREEKRTTRVNTARFEFRFKMYNSENVGIKGRSRSAVGWRYGAPQGDRSKGHELKIPTSVP